MALTGHLGELSLSELIEFFCNQRKMGLLKVHYPRGSGSFFLSNGSVVDAKIGVLRGIDAVYYALTLPNAEFEFKGAAEPAERTINQPWTQVVLEGLRRLDEGITAPEAFPDGMVFEDDDDQSIADAEPEAGTNEPVEVPAFLSSNQSEGRSGRKPMMIGLAAAAVVLIVAAIGVPAGWYSRGKAAVAVSQPASTATPAPQPATPEPTATQAQATPGTGAEDQAAAAARRQKELQKEKERKAREERAGAQKPPDTAQTPVANGKRVTVQVTYDESGRVVQASGGDPTALRIARQKRFPPGKAGTTTVTIPIN